MRQWTDQQLMAYFEESLTSDLMAAIEEQLRRDQQLRERLINVVGTRDAGVHAMGDIWRRHRLSCPTRQQLGSYLLGAVDTATEDYMQFHLKQIGCRYCQANLDDLREQQAAVAAEGVQQRRRKYFQTSAGYLRKPGGSD